MKKYLDLIFDGRVKDYGAYKLRMDYPKRLLLSTLISCAFVTLLFVLPIVMSSKEISKSDVTITAEYLIVPKLNEPPKEVIKPKKVENFEKKSDFRSNVKFSDIEVTDDEIFDNLKTQDEMLNQKVGYEDSNDSSDIFRPIEDNLIEVEKVEEKIFSFAEEMPKYNGDLYSDLSKHIVYPEYEKNSGIECLLYVTFVVDKNGDVSDVKVLRPCEESSRFSDVALSAVKKIGKFSPAKMNGNPVSLRMTIPIKFSLR